MSERNRLLSSEAAGDADAPKRSMALFLCVDQAYFLGALTFLASYVIHNRRRLTSVPTIVFLGDDAPAYWGEILRRFADRIGLRLEIVPESAFGGEGRPNSGSWGFFSGGGGLSGAAYFRLYAARHLGQERTYERLCYVDADMVCHGDLKALFDLELDGLPLAARREEVRVEVAQAADRNGIARGDYFNSGVLIFDTGHDQFESRLSEAIRLCEQEPERLYFLDQCALNIAFVDAAQRLPRDFNVFLRPDRAETVEVGAGKLLHFVGGPKPWDVSYSREYRDHWRRYAEVVKLLLSPSDYTCIVRAANGARVAG